MQIAGVFLAALLAAGFSAGLNFLFREAGRAGITYLGPIFEEWLKTGLALFFNASLPGTHILFGVLEAVGDFVWGAGGKKLPAALSGIAAHTVFGLIAFLLINSGYQVYIAVLSSIGAHVAWNWAVLKLSGRK
ncbi:MAG: hypothetical protein JL50_06555 [Peptococcaceae bacterium BICA1-7]|nr:MAG: hypothetical protein JL50_06555 [Peptococcaceae bacterium BICA1-7]HBV99271.1 hypothetical protein [Desulfotomaculum sp.]